MRPSPGPCNRVTQLNNIEGKLDALLRRFDQLQPPTQTPTAAQISAAAPSTAAPSSGPAGAAQKPGALAIARVAPKTRDDLSNIPADSVGSFVYTGGPIPLTDIQARGVHYPGPVGVELQGWLRAPDAGRYEIADAFTTHFGAGTTITPTCFFQTWLEDHSLGENTTRLSNPGHAEASASLILGANLQPGLYRLRVWTTCTQPEHTPTTSELLIKTPADMNLRPSTGSEIVHREK